MSNDGAKEQFRRYLEVDILPLMVQAAKVLNAFLRFVEIAMIEIYMLDVKIEFIFSSSSKTPSTRMRIPLNP